MLEIWAKIPRMLVTLVRIYLALNWLYFEASWSRIPRAETVPNRMENSPDSNLHQRLLEQIVRAQVNWTLENLKFTNILLDHFVSAKLVASVCIFALATRLVSTGFHWRLSARDSWVYLKRPNWYNLFDRSIVGFGVFRFLFFIRSFSKILQKRALGFISLLIFKSFLIWQPIAW